MIERLTTELAPLLSAIVAAGGRPLIVGGAPRDLLLGQAPADVDVEVYGIDAARLVAALAPFGRVDAVGRSFGVLKLRLAGREVDVALPQRRSPPGAVRGALAEVDPALTPAEALARRDFTINALALTPAGELLDFFGGRADLRDRVLRHTSDAFGDDPLRVLRAVQLAGRLDMRLAPATAALCRSLLPHAASLAIERVWGEWQKWAARAVRPSAGLRALIESGWITCYPGLLALDGCPQDPRYHPEGDVLVHTQHVCDAAALIAARDALGADERAVLLLAALCHDLGKPLTTFVDADGAVRSPGHAPAGVAPADELLGQLGAPRRLAEVVAPLVREHMAHHSGPPTARAVRRLAARLAPATIASWGRLVEADASGRPPRPPASPGAAFVALAHRLGAADGQPAPLVHGRDLLAAGFSHGPQLGELLRRAYEAQLDGAFVTTEDGIAWVRQIAEGATR